jgi:hypothetical protein
VGKLWVLVFVMGCVAEPAEPVLDDDPVFAGKVDQDAESGLCSLAAALGPDNVCSSLCDPDAFAQALVDAGYESGRCYLLACQLTDDITVGAAACLP